MSSKEIISKKIKEKRLKLALTQKQIADKLNVSRTSIADWESGRYLPCVIIFIRLMKLLKIKVKDL